MENIGEKIMQARKTKGMTQDTLAQLVNVSRQTVSHWENGRAMPDVAMAAQLSKVLGVNFLADEAAEDAAVQPPEAMPTVQEPVQETQKKPTVGLLIRRSSRSSPVSASESRSSARRSSSSWRRLSALCCRCCPRRRRKSNCPIRRKMRT